jgi:hypothetical protein
MYDRDMIKKDDLIGELEIEVMRFFDKPPTQETRKWRGRGSKGAIILTIAYGPISVPFPRGIATYKGGRTSQSSLSSLP